MPYKNIEHKKKYRKELRENRKQLGLCTTEGCNQKSLPGRVKCEAHRQYNNRIRLQWGKTVEGRFKHNKSRTLRQGWTWKLTFDEYANLLIKPCVYCGGVIDGSGSGLDQITPRGGYVAENVVPCCHVCNRIKMEVFTYEEMMELKPLLIKFRLSRNGRWPKFARFRWGDNE